MAEVSNELSENVSKLVELSKQLKEAKSDIKGHKKLFLKTDHNLKQNR